MIYGFSPSILPGGSGGREPLLRFGNLSCLFWERLPRRKPGARFRPALACRL